MARKLGWMLAYGWLVCLLGCGISITLPGGSTCPPGSSCTPDGGTGKSSGGPGTTGSTSPPGATGSGSGSTGSGSTGGAGTGSTGTTGSADAGPPTAPPTEPVRPACQRHEDCKPGQRCKRSNSGIPECTDVPCDTLGRDECQQARGRCFLEWLEPEKYKCRDAAHQCEKRDLKSCSQDLACHWNHGHCYCPEDADCECGGGPPRNCEPTPCNDLVSCYKYCTSKYQCCPPHGPCEDIYMGCSLSQTAPTVCRQGIDCRFLDKNDCAAAPGKCVWQGTCVEK